MKNLKYKAVIFDLDGTLIDSMGIWLQVDKEYLRKRNIAIPADLFNDVPEGNSFLEICQYFKDKFNLPDSIEEIGSEWTEMVAKHYENDIKLKPGAENLIKFLAANQIKMAIGTSNSQYLAKTVLVANGVMKYFSAIVAGCKEIKGKPYPDIFLRVAQEISVKSRDCLVIEDTQHGVQAAHNAGMDAFAIFDDNDTHDAEILKQEADFYADDFLQIMNELKTLVQS